MFRYAALLFILCGVDVSRFVLLVCDMFSFPFSVLILLSSPTVLRLLLLLLFFRQYVVVLFVPLLFSCVFRVPAGKHTPNKWAACGIQSFAQTSGVI